jgi:hypothetical protein
VRTARAECSAKTQKGVKTVFDEAIRAKMEKDSEAIMYTEIINDIDDMADAVELAQEAGLVVSAGETLDALKARLMAHYVHPDHDHAASCLQAQGMQIDTDTDLVEVLAIIAELDDINDAFELAKDEGIAAATYAGLDMAAMQALLIKHFTGGDAAPAAVADDDDDYDADEYAEMISEMTEDDARDVCFQEDIDVGKGASLAEMQAALRGYYCGAHDEGQTHVHAAQAEGGYRISAADYLDCLAEMTLAEMQDAVQVG